jgi:hypothetical protein
MRRVTTLYCLLLLLTACHLTHAQHLGSRLQWQPQTESDPRLQQSLQIEIIGRAAITGLPILSEKTGVTLTVAPEDLATVGERKFTVIAQGCTLKAIMVQLCEALQECHWDVDTAGKEPMYLLHRNAGVDEAAAARAVDMVAARQATRRRALAERVEAAKAALAMSPEELEQLEQSDLFLARGVKRPLMRATLEGLFSLPEEQIARLGETGLVGITYSEATPQLRRAASLALENMLEEAQRLAREDGEDEQTGPTQAEVAGWREVLSRELPADTSLRFRFSSRGEIVMFVRGPAQTDAPEWSAGAYAVLSRYPVFSDSYITKKLLTDTGETEAAAADLARAWWQREKDEREAEQARQNRRERGPLPPQFGQMVTVETHDMMSLGELLLKLARGVGLSLMCDYSSDDRFSPEPGLLPDPIPVHEALDKLAPIAGFVWDAAGECLTVHRTQWYDLAQQEVPESLLDCYREKLRTQGRFTLEDAVSLAMKLRESRPEPQGRGPSSFLPDDLRETGLASLLHGQAAWCVRLLAALTHEQRAQAEAPEGLEFGDMTRTQQNEVLRRAENRFPGKGVARAREARLRLQRHESVFGAHQYANYQIELEFPGDERETLTANVRLRGAEAPPEALPSDE